MLKRFQFPCDCGCGILAFEQFDDEKDELFITHYVASFYAGQKSTLKSRIWMAFCALTGREFLLYEIVLRNEVLQNFKDFCGDFSGRKTDKENEEIYKKYKKLISMLD